MNIDEWAHNNHHSVTKLHLGCGSRYLEGWCNIDGYKLSATDTHRGTLKAEPDIWCDIKNLPASDQSVDIILTQHVVEHFYRHQAIHLFNEFWRVLKPGGVIITEMPDLGRILFLLSILPKKPFYPASMGANRDMIKSQLYGAAWEENDLGYQCHKYVWERREFEEVLRKMGFDLILSSGSTKSHVPFRDMVVIARKASDSLGPTGYSSSEVRDIVNSYGTHHVRMIKQMRSLVNLVIKSVISR
jgi:SAM-dependent methyltransferase